MIFICGRHGNDTSPTSRFFFGFCRGTVGYTSNMPVDTADQWFAYCTSTMTQKYKWKLTHSVGSTQKYKSALRQHTAQLYCTDMLALLRMRPVAVKTGLKGEADLLFLGSFQWWVRLQELTCFFVPCRLVPINHCGSPVLSSEYPFLWETFQSSHAFPTIVPNLRAHLFTTFSVLNVYTGPYPASIFFQLASHLTKMFWMLNM